MRSVNQELKIYNSISGEKETFNTVTKDHVGMYVCGPTAEHILLNEMSKPKWFKVWLKLLTGP